MRLIVVACTLALAVSSAAAMKSAVEVGNGVAAQEEYSSGFLAPCKPVKDEKFANQIKNTCSARVSRDDFRFSFYYQLNNGTIMRNCDCNSYYRGVTGVKLGYKLRESPSVKCFTRENKYLHEVIAIFNHDRLLCSPFDFK